MIPASKRSVRHGKQRNQISSCEVATPLERCVPGSAGACIRPDAHGYAGFAWIFGTLQGAALLLIETRALIWRAGGLPVGEQISLWRVLGFAIAFGVSRHVEVGLARDLLGYASFCVLCRVRSPHFLRTSALHHVPQAGDDGAQAGTAALACFDAQGQGQQWYARAFGPEPLGEL